MDDNPVNYMASLESIEWSDKSYNLSAFLDENGASLPHVVKVVEGFCGVASSCTIDSGQHLILHALQKETKILAKDSKDYDLFIPKNFQVKVEMVPKHSFEEYSTIKDVLRTFPNYFRVIEDIPSLEVSSDSIFKIVRQNTFTNYIECLQVGKDENESKTKFPLNLQGRFQPLQDSREFFLDEVLMEDCLPVTVHFVKSMNTCTKGNNKVSLDELGNVLLIGECETESVFATVLNCNGKSLAVFPKNLNITVQPACVNDGTYRALQEDIIVNQDKTLKRIQRLNKLGLYQARNPIQQFPLIDILPPILPKLRAQSVMEAGNPGHPPHLMKEGKRKSFTMNRAEERSNSTPPDPKLIQPQQSAIMKTPDKRGIKKLPLKTSSCYASHPQTPQQNNKKHPIHKPPPIPVNAGQAPPLPVKEKNKPKQSADTPSTPQTDTTLKQLSPTTPTPPPRRRRKTHRQKADVPEEIIDDQGYVKMNESDEIKNPDDYEQMKLPFQSPLCTKNADKSNMTLAELFGVDDDANETAERNDRNNNNFVPGKQGVERGININHNLTSSEADDLDSNDYYDIKNLDLTQICEDVDSHDYVNTSIDPPGKSSEEDQERHSYENTQSLDLNTLVGLSLDGEQNNKDCTTTEQALFCNESRKTVKKRYAYENTSHLNRDLPQQTPEKTSVEGRVFPSYDNTKVTDFQSPGASTSAPIYANVKDDSGYENVTGMTVKQDVFNGVSSINQRKGFQEAKSSSDENNHGYENTANLNIRGGTDSSFVDKTSFDTCMPVSSPMRSLTKTEQLVNEIKQKRLSPIGMDETMLNEEDQYTCMDGDYPFANKKLDTTFQDQFDGGFYVAMNESNHDADIYENETDDDFAGPKKVSCYEVVDLPHSRKEGDGSSKDDDWADLHYHEVDLSALALPCDGDDVYEDIEMPDVVSPPKPKTPQRPPPPSRFGRSQRTTTKSEGEPILFKTPPASPPKVSSSLDSKFSNIQKKDFEHFDDVQLHLGIVDSLKGIKKSNSTRPPAPPPKKLNYVKVDTTSGVPLKSISKKIPTPTTYSDIVATEQPKTRSKEDDMEYVDDCQLHLFDVETRKMEQKRKELRNTKENLSNKAPKHENSKRSDVKEQVAHGSHESSKRSDIKQQVAHGSHDSREGINTHDKNEATEKGLLHSGQPFLNNTGDIKKQIEQLSCDGNKPMKPLIPSRKHIANTNELKNANTSTASAEHATGKPMSTDSIKKRALLPPPKPKRLFLNNEKSKDNTSNASGGNIQQSPATDSTSTQFNRKREGTKKKPLPLPRKKTN